MREHPLIIEIERVEPDGWKIIREVRLAALADAPDWFWATYADEVDEPEAWWRDFIGAGAWFVAVEEDVPAGIVAAIRDPGLGETELQLISMWVAPAMRGRGIGAALIERLKEWARGEGVTHLRLDVTEGNDDAFHLYVRCGFQPTGHTTPHPRDPSLAEREMRLRV